MELFTAGTVIVVR